MKALHVLFAVPAVLGLLSVGCGKASPEAQLDCVNSADVTVVGSAQTIVVQKGVTKNDPGLGGAVPANGVIADVMSPVDFVLICEGNCTDGDGSFDQTQEVTTDDNGFLIYTLGFLPTAVFEGEILESFNPSSQCVTTVSYTP